MKPPRTRHHTRLLLSYGKLQEIVVTACITYTVHMFHLILIDKCWLSCPENNNHHAMLIENGRVASSVIVLLKTPSCSSHPPSEIHPAASLLVQAVDKAAISSSLPSTIISFTSQTIPLLQSRQSLCAVLVQIGGSGLHGCELASALCLLIGFVPVIGLRLWLLVPVPVSAAV